MKKNQPTPRLALLMAGWFALNTAVAVPPPAGTAPVAPPPNGFAIDGDLLANTPTINVGDWVSNTNLAPGSGGGVLRTDGSVIDSTRTFHIVDPFNDSSNDRIFAGGAKWLDNPNTWTWTTGKPSSKTDMNNALLHITSDTNGHVWAILAADRLSTSGDSYIDFELLQNSLTRNTNGTFTSVGPNSGRTTNDLLLSLAFTGGGKVADFFAWRWTTNGAGGFAYADVTTLLPAGRVFVALNSNTIAAPYSAFGGTTYAANAFAEAAIDLTELLAGFNPCESFGFKTIMIKTKASSSSSAGIEDFIDPIAYNLTIGPSANAGADQVRCLEGTETAFPLLGTTASGIQPIASNVWSVVSGAATIDNPLALNTTARVVSASAVLRLTVYQVNGCQKSDDVVLTVQQPPVCAITGPGTLCPRTTNTFSAPAAMTQYAWTVSGNGFISGPTNQATVKVVAGAVCGQSYTLALTTRSNVCTVSCATEVLVTDTTPPVITCPPDRVLDCPANTSTNNTGVATAVDSCSRVTLSYSDSETNGCGVSKVIARTWTAVDECGNATSCTQLITVRDVTPPVLTCPTNAVRECGQDTSPAVTGTARATDACGSAVVNFSDSATSPCPGSQIITRTWTATDACGNQSSCQQIITVQDTTPPDFAANIVCSATAAELVDGSVAGLLATNYSTLFPQGLMLGLYSPTNGTTAPNGLVFQADANGLAALQAALTSTGTSGVISQDAINPSGTFGAGELGRQTLALAINIALNESGLVGAGPNNFGKLIYTQSGDALSGKSVAEILGRAQQALAGSGLPAGYTFDTLAALIGQLNGAFGDCTASTFAKTRLSTPVILVSCGAQVPSPNFSLIVAKDSCSSVTIRGLPDVITNMLCANRLTLIRSWSATDACGNSSVASMKIIIDDSSAPVISCPANVTLEYPANLNPTNTGTATATDNCGVAGIRFDDAATNVCGVGQIIKRTWSAWDACQNVATCVQTITVRDTTPPVITCPTNAIVECGGSVAPAATGAATATDLAGANVTFADTVTPGCGGSYVISRRWTATDPCGNASSCTQTITVRDTTAPILTCPTNRTLECPADISTNNTGVATATDVCSAVTVSFSDASATVCGNARIISRTWRATDACGNSSSCVQTLTIRDTTPPTLTIPNAATVECGGSVAPSATGQATATDACNAVNVSFTDSVSNSCGNARIILRRWVAMDSCNNSNVAVQTITVRDTTPPTLTLPANRILNCPGDTRTNNTGMATATDVCSGVTISYSDVVSNSCGITKTIQRTWTAVDQCGNTANGVQTIVVQDTPPTITCPTVKVQCVGDVPPAYTNIAAFRAAGGVASDTCDADLDFAFVSDSGLVGRCPGTVTRVYRVTDDCGLSAQCTQTIIVDDTIAPTLACPSSVTVECGSSIDPTALGSATATDNCTTNVVVTHADSILDSTYDLRWYASDSDSGTGPYAPTYLKLGPGSLPCPTGGRAIDPLRNAVCFAANGQLDALTSMGSSPLALGQIVPFQLVIQADGGPGTEKGVIEVTTRWNTYTTSNDRFGYDTNYMVYCAFVDAGDPGSIDPHYNAKVDAFTSKLINRGSVDEKIEGTFRISGLDSGDRIIVEVWMVLQSTMPDHVGGTISSELAFARKLSTPEQVIPLSNQTIPIGNLSKFTTLPPAQPQPPAPQIPPQPPVPPGRTTSVIDRTWAATDDCGNRSTCVQRITVRDTIAPALVAPADVTLECPANTATNNTGIATVTDGCGTPALSYSDVVSNACGFTKTILRTWVATDGNNNTSSAVQKITVVDTTPPTMSSVTNKTIDAGAVLTFSSPTATDTCGSAIVSVLSTTTNTLSGGAYSVTRTWIATDACGNQSTSQAQTITVNAPVTVVPTLSKLTILPSTGGNLLLRWPTNATEYRLECAAASDAKRWYPVAITPTVTNGECRVLVPLTGPCQFFRLVNSPPYLESLRFSAGNLRLTWPTAPSGFVLEASDTMAPGSWTTVVVTPGVSNTLNHVTIPASAAKKFYRLKK